MTHASSNLITASDQSKHTYPAHSAHTLMASLAVVHPLPDWVVVLCKCEGTCIYIEHPSRDFHELGSDDHTIQGLQGNRPITAVTTCHSIKTLTASVK